MNGRVLDLSRWLGGPLGTRASRSGVWFTAGPWVMLLGTLNWLVCMLRQIPCRQGADVYLSMCYTDIVPLYYHRGLSEGRIPFLDSEVEYPVLTGGLMELARRIVVAMGAVSAPGATDAEVARAASLFFGVTAVILFGFFLLLLWAHLRMARPFDALMIALSPAVATAGLINWDTMVMAFLALALLAWSRRRPFWAGVWTGLGLAAKLYPVLLLVPLAVLCLRTGRWRAYLITVAGTVVSWVAVNLPVYLATPEGWLNFWTFNVDRGMDLGSIWYVLDLAGFEVPSLSMLVAAIMVAGTALICLALLLAPRRPRVTQGLFLVVALFLMVNKVYSPQYVLWLLPILALALPRWSEWSVFAITETFYFVAIWGHLGGWLTPGNGGPDRVYWVAVAARVAGQAYLCGRILWEIWHPAADVVRDGGLDDPDGGVLDGAPDLGWVRRLHRRHAEAFS